MTISSVVRAAQVALHRETGAIAMSWDDSGWVVVCPPQRRGGRATARAAVDGEVEFTSGAWTSTELAVMALPEPNSRDAVGPLWQTDFVRSNRARWAVYVDSYPTNGRAPRVLVNGKEVWHPDVLGGALLAAHREAIRSADDAS